MPLTNTPRSYGSVTRGFHWLTALLVLSTIPLGYLAFTEAQAVRNPDIATTDADAARAALLFSIHKTVGVAIFLVSALRILWALVQPRPGLLNGDRPLEAWLAQTVHWLLYGSLVAVPLSGWISHAATTGFAPIWWPLGQSLPSVPKDAGVARLFATLHYLLQWVLVGAITLHILGALKHHLIDGDATLRRMLSGQGSGQPTRRQPGHALPLLSALVVWGTVLGGAGALGWYAPAAPAPNAPNVALAPVQGEWQVQHGTLGITITQLGSKVGGSFADWTADISYSETPDASGRYGKVTVTVAIPSLTLGSVTDQAMGPDYFDARRYPKAVFEADIVKADRGHVARGTLTIKGNSVPIEMPFDLSIEGGTATARGGLTVDRRDFGIAPQTTDEGTLGFAVGIAFELTARRM